MKDIFLAFLFLASVASGQVLTPEQISAQIEIQKENPDQEIAQATIAVLKEAQSFAEQLATAKSEEASFKAKVGAGEKMPEFEDFPAPAADASLEDINTTLTEVSAALESSSNRISDATNASKNAAVRMPELGLLIAEAREELSELAEAPGGEGALEKAQRERSEIQTSLLQAKIERYQAEQTFLQAEMENMPERIRMRKEHNADLTKLQRNLQARAAVLRGQQVRQTADELKGSSERFSHIPKLAALVDEITELNDQRTGKGGLQEQIEDATTYQKRITRLQTRIESQESNAKNRIDLLESVGLGIDSETGIVLREQRAKLPSTVELEKEVRSNVEVAVRSQVSLLDLRDKLNQDPPLSSAVVSALTEAEVNRLLAEDPTLQNAEETERFRKEVTALFEQRKSLLEALISERGSLQATLDTTNAKAQETINAINSYSVFLDQRLLWIRSTMPITLTEPRSELGNIRELFAPTCSPRLGLVSANAGFLASFQRWPLRRFFSSGSFGGLVYGIWKESGVRRRPSGTALAFVPQWSRF